MAFFKPIMFLEDSLTTLGVKGYVLKDQYAIFWHDNEHVYLSLKFANPHVDVFVYQLREFHRKGLLVFKDEALIERFASELSRGYFNLNTKFDKWGEFNFENILEFCDPVRILPSAVWFSLDVYPECLLDVGECLEEDICFYKHNPVRIFKSPPLTPGDLMDRIEILIGDFQKRERALMVAEILGSDLILKVVGELLDASSSGHMYGITGHTFQDLGITNLYLLKESMGSFREELPSRLSNTDRSSLYYSKYTKTFKKCGVYRLLEVCFQHAPLTDDMRPVSEFFKFDDFHKIIFEGNSHHDNVSLDGKYCKAELISFDSTSTTFLLSITVNI